VSGQPFPKSSQLARGERRYRRKVASPKQWQAIIEAKRGPCRVCGVTHAIGHTHHHVVPRDMFGDDVADNIVPVGWSCHERIERRDLLALRALAESLTDAEYAYVVGKLGEGGMARLFGTDAA
jgi:hypothetical protein